MLSSSCTQLDVDTMLGRLAGELTTPSCTDEQISRCPPPHGAGTTALANVPAVAPDLGICWGSSISSLAAAMGAAR